MCYHLHHCLITKRDISKDIHHLDLHVQAYKSIDRAHLQNRNHLKLETLVLIVGENALPFKIWPILRFMTCKTTDQSNALNNFTLK